MSWWEKFTPAERREIEANAERVRRAVAPGNRAERTHVVYDTAMFMREVPLAGEEITLVFAALAWARENQ